MTEPRLGSIPLPVAGGDEGSSKKSAKEMLKKALEDHGAAHNRDSGSSTSSTGDPSSGSSNIVDMLFKDFITKKITPPGALSSAPAAKTVSIEKSHGEVSAGFKKGSRSSMNEINQLLDQEINSMNIKPGSHHHGDKPEEDRRKHSKSSSSSSSSSKSKSYDSMSKSIVNTQPSLVSDTNKVAIPFTMPEPLRTSSVPQMVPPPAPSTVPLQSSQPQPPHQWSAPALDHSLATHKKVTKVAPKLLPLKLSDESLSLIKVKEKDEEEGEVFSSSSDSSVKDDNSSSSGEIVSDEEALQGGKAWRSKHKKSKHKHKKKKKKKKSKSKDKIKEKKSETKLSKSSTTTTSSDDKRFADLGTRTIINNAALAKDSAEGSGDSVGKNEDSDRQRSKSTEDKHKEVSEKKRLDSEDDKRHYKKKNLENEDDKKHEKKKKKRSRSRSKSRSPKKSKRSRSRSPKKSKRSRSRSPKKSKSRSSKSRSKSPKRSKHSRSRSRSPKKSRRSRSRSPRRSKRSRSRSPKRPKRSRSRSPRRSRRSRSRSPRRDKDGSSRDKDRKTSKEKRDHDLRVKIDKGKLRKIAMANALKSMTAGQGPEVSIVSRAGGKSVEELTNFCKKISDREKNVDEVSESEEEVMEELEEESLIHHPFKMREASNNIVMNIRNSRQLPVMTPVEKQAQQATLRLTFPVSSGSTHRDTESEWTPVEPKPPEPKKKFEEKVGKSVPEIAAPPKEKSIFPENQEVNVDIGSIISERLQAVRKLQQNPYDVQALTKMHKIQEKSKMWGASKQLPGQFMGSTGVQVLSQAQLSGDRRHQAWAKKTQLTSAEPVKGGIGMLLLQRMGWKDGQGLGKHNTGNTLPLMLDVKVDRKGLKSIVEGNKGGHKINPGKPQARAKDLSGKHPVSALMELCNKRRWGAPHFTPVNETGPDHQKHFLFKVKVNNIEYQPAVASPNKKLAKAQCAAVCLQEMGLIPRDAPLNI